MFFYHLFNHYLSIGNHITNHGPFYISPFLTLNVNLRRFNPDKNIADIALHRNIIAGKMKKYREVLKT
jgi:hypothetical protein